MNETSIPQPGDLGVAPVRSIQTEWQFARPERVRVRGRAAWRRGLDCEHGLLPEYMVWPSRWEGRSRFGP